MTQVGQERALCGCRPLELEPHLLLPTTLGGRSSAQSSAVGSASTDELLSSLSAAGRTLQLGACMSIFTQHVQPSCPACMQHAPLGALLTALCKAPPQAA